MKLLLDESVPRRLAVLFPELYIVRTVQEMGWAGTGNGRLLFLAAAEGFDVLVTVVEALSINQNADALSIAIVVMLAPRNRLRELQPFVPMIGNAPAQMVFLTIKETEPRPAYRPPSKPPCVSCALHVGSGCSLRWRLR